MKRVAEFEAHDNYVLALQFSADGRRLVSSGMDSVAKVWSVPDWQPISTLKGHQNSVNSLSLSPDQTRLATGSTDATVRLWSFPECELLHELRDRKKTVSSVQFSPDGQWVVAGYYGGRAVVWTRDGEELVGIKASAKNLSAASFSMDGKTLATSGLGDDIHLWTLPYGNGIGVLSGHKTAVGSLVFTRGGQHLLSLGYEGDVRFWDTSTWQTTRVETLGAAGGRGLTLSPDGATVALALEGKVELRSVAEWALLDELSIETKVVSSMAYSADGAWFACGAADKRIRVWSLP